MPCLRLPPSPSWAVVRGQPASSNGSQPTSPELFDGPLSIHVVEPYEPGSGQDLALRPAPGTPAQLHGSGRHDVHRRFRGLRWSLRRRSGPRRMGRRRGGRFHPRRSRSWSPDLLEQLRALTGATFPTRQLQSDYLEWFFRRAVAALGPDVTSDGPPGHGTAVETIQSPTAAGTASGSPPTGCSTPTSWCTPWATRTRGPIRNPPARRLRRPPRRVPRGASLHHRRRLFGDCPRPGRNGLGHGAGVRGPAGAA